MRHLPKAGLALMLVLCTLVASAQDYPRVVFPEGHSLVVDAEGAVTVDVPLLQIELQPGLVLAAAKGTRVALTRADGEGSGHTLQVAGGTLTVLNLRDNAVLRVPEGSYRLETGSGAAISVDALPAAQASPDTAETGVLAPGFRISDAIMTQQQKYLDSLKIDVRDINSVLASIIRSLVPKR